MTKSEALAILLSQEWNEDGALEIIEALDNIEGMTEADLIEVSEDYKDR